MNNRRYHFITDFINILLHFLASFALIGIAVLFTTRNTASVVKAFILLPAPIISYLIGKYTKHIWSFLVLHIIMTAAYAFTSHNGFVTAFYMIYLILLTILALKNKLQEDTYGKTNSPLILLSPFVAMYLLNNYLGTTGLNSLVFALVIIFVLLYLLNMYLINFEVFFQKHSNITNVPIKQIKNTNHILILFFVSLCVIIMIFFTKLPIKELLSVTGSLLLGLLRMIISLFPAKEEETAPLENMEPESAAPPLDLLDTGPTSLIWQYIQNILSGLFTIALIAGTIALILYGLYRIYQRFYGSKNNNFRDKTEFISPFDKKEGIHKEASKTVNKKFFHIFGRTNNEKIRRYFYKAVISGNKTENIPTNLTPVQLSKYAFTGQNRSSEEACDTKKAKLLAAYYEKARYSEEECTKAEVTQVKNIIRK